MTAKKDLRIQESHNENVTFHINVRTEEVDIKRVEFLVNYSKPLGDQLDIFSFTSLPNFFRKR